MTASMRVLDRAPQLELNGREAWRRWLERNHTTATGVWLVSPRRAGGRRDLEYDAMVEEALCFGWIDGQAAGVDEQRSKQYFARRRVRSSWSKSNKERFQRMLLAGLVAPAGMAAVERARSDGSWSILEPVERLEVPADLATALDGCPPARRNWEAFPPSARRALLSWIAMARRAETRARRIEETAAAARRNERARGAAPSARPHPPIALGGGPEHRAL
jgi:uncharacterized protein YdeI (YjbR/CyaY-like superfamily)